MDRCSSSDLGSARDNLPLGMCRVDNKVVPQGEEHCFQAGTSQSVKTLIRKAASVEVDDLPATINFPDGEELYLSRRLEYGSRKPDDTVRLERILADCSRNSPSSTQDVECPGEQSTSSGGVAETKTPHSGLPVDNASQKTAVAHPKTCPWPSQFGSCINPPPNRTVFQVTERPRANSLSKLHTYDTKKKIATFSSSLMAKKTVTSPHNTPAEN